MTELELKQLEDKVAKAKGIASNIHAMKMVYDDLTGIKDEQRVGIVYLGHTIYTSKARFSELLDKSIADYKELLEKL